MKPSREIKNKMYITTPFFCTRPFGYIVCVSNIYSSCDRNLVFGSNIISV
jgi:hypothetical protein